MVIKKQSQIMLITGLSGSGKTIALQSLEDLGFYCIDNLSPNMILKIIEFTQSTKNNFFNKNFNIALTQIIEMKIMF